MKGFFSRCLERIIRKGLIFGKDESIIALQSDASGILTYYVRATKEPALDRVNREAIRECF